MDDNLINYTEQITIYVDGEKIDGVALDGVPIPLIDTGTATLGYYTMPHNRGQQIIDIAAHTETGIHEYKVDIANIYTWIYDGRISRYRLLEDGVLGATVEIELCGKFQYIRNGELSSEMDFSN